jgi:hypothetical protein
MKKILMTCILAMCASAAFAQQTAPTCTDGKVSGPPIIVEPSTNEPILSPSGVPPDEVSGPPAPVLTKADKGSDDNGALLAGVGLVGLIGLGKLAQKRKAKKAAEGIGCA